MRENVCTGFYLQSTHAQTRESFHHQKEYHLSTPPLMIGNGELNDRVILKSYGSYGLDGVTVSYTHPHFYLVTSRTGDWNS